MLLSLGNIAISEFQTSTVIHWVASFLFTRPYYPENPVVLSAIDQCWIVFSPLPYENHTIQFHDYGADIPFTAEITHCL